LNDERGKFERGKNGAMKPPRVMRI